MEIQSGTPDEALAARIACSIVAHPELSLLGKPAVPERSTAARLLDAVRELVFPGFHPTAHAATHADATSFAAERVVALRSMLRVAVEGAIHHGAPTASITDEAREIITLADRADSIAAAVLQAIPDLRDAIAQDVEAAYRGDPAARSRAEVIVWYPGISALLAHRFAHELWTRGVPILPRLIAEIAHAETGIDIHPGATIGAGTFIDHGTGVVIGETCTIGRGCRIYQGVTLGALRFEAEPDGTLRRGTKRHPTLEDDVTVYAGATILGGDTVIGAGSVVAGGVFVTRSVQPGHLVAGPKMQVRVLPHGGEMP
jgi:serine O-acetyltransferase